jgi:16S rRNA (uracil1498-N3)-methyltransferase
MTSTLFFQPGIGQGIEFLTDEEAHHALNVLRLKTGDEISVTDGKGTICHAVVKKLDGKKCYFEIRERQSIPPRPFHITIALAPTKSIDRTEWFVEKAVETGIEEIYFFISQRSERKKVNMERVKKIALGAMKQSGQVWLPQITGMHSFSELLKWNAGQKFIGIVDRGNPLHLKQAAQPKLHYFVLIGPEGDFTPEEARLAMDHGFEKVSLSPHRLRTETAALTACQILNFINS